MPTALIAIVIALTALTPACSSASKTEVRAAGQSGQTTGPRCVAVTAAIDAISKGLRLPAGGGLADAAAVALRPPVGGFGYVVAAEIEGPDMEGPGQVALWAVASLDGGAIVALNNFATEFSTWRPAADGGADVRGIVGRDEVRLTKTCTRQLSGLPG